MQRVPGPPLQSGGTEVTNTDIATCLPLFLIIQREVRVEVQTKSQL